MWLAVVPQEPQEGAVRRLFSRRRLGAAEGVEGAVAVELERVLFGPQRARAGDVVAPQRSRRQSRRRFRRLLLGCWKVRRRVQGSQGNVDGRLAPSQATVVGARIFRSQEQELVGGRGARERRVGLHDHQIAVDVDDVVVGGIVPAAGAHGFMFRRRSACTGHDSSTWERASDHCGLRGARQRRASA